MVRSEVIRIFMDDKIKYYAVYLGRLAYTPGELNLRHPVSLSSGYMTSFLTM